MAIEIGGHSDDVVSIRETRRPEGRALEWEDELSPNTPIRVGTETGGVEVVMRFDTGGSGTWAALVRQVGEGIPIPWPVTISEADAGTPGCPDRKSYSVLVSVACPPGTPVRCGKRVVPRG